MQTQKTPPTPAQLKVHVYADGANREDMLKRYREGFVKGFTTNPTLIAKAGVKDYEGFAKEILKEIKDLPISFEVFSDEYPEMERQADKIASWGPNVNVKIPIMNTKSEPALPLIRRLLDKGQKLNVTAIFTQEQLNGLREILRPQDDVIVSIFAGRIADTGIDPVPLMKKAVEDYKHLPKAKILWASPREVLNAYQAEECGCQIITATDDIIGKLKLSGKNLTEYSLETVKMFYNDAQKAGFQL
jgi:transaldolase